MRWDAQILYLLGGVFGLLVVASAIGGILAARASSKAARATVLNLNQRIRAWWMMCMIFVVAMATGGIGSVVLFALMSFLALREYITILPTQRADHRALFWSFFIITPIQYYLVATQWYGLFVIFIPVYAFLFIPIRLVLAGDTRDFLARAAKIQWGLLLCVYFVSHAPALLMLKLPGYIGQNGKLLFFFVTIVELNDVMQYTWGKAFGRHKIAPTVSPNKTWEGFVGGVLSCTALGAGLSFVTPFNWWQGATLAFGVAVLGFFGDVTLSAVKRDSGIKDYGSVISGHGGVLDRIDSLCFAAPFFFHMVRYWFGAASAASVA